MGGALHFGVECTITFRIISEMQQSHGIRLHNYTMLMLFNLMLSFKPRTNIKTYLGDASAALSNATSVSLIKCNDVDNHVRSGGISNTPAP